MDKKQRPKIIIISAMHGRHDTVKYCLNQMPFIEKYMVYSTKVDGHFLEKQDVKSVRKFPNNPLSGKWNAAIEFLKGIEFDGVILLGSDDYIDEGFVEFIQDNIEKYDLIGFKDIYFEQGNAMYYWAGYDHHRKGEPAGAGKAYSKKFLEQIDFNLFPYVKKNGLDGMSWTVCKNANAKILTASIMDEGIFLCDVKDGLGITPLHKIPNLTEIK